MHCSDSKREIIYIKNDNQWEKNSEEKDLLTDAIKHIAHKNVCQISAWQQKYPAYKDGRSKCNDKYNKIVGEAMPGFTIEETHKKYKKVARNIMKGTIIDKL